MSFLRTSLLTLVLGMAGLAVAEKASPKGNSAPPSAETIIRKVDELFRSKSSRGSMEMEIRTPNWSRTLKIQLWTRNMDETFLTIDAPQKDKGVSTLRKGKEMWNYFPKINKVMKVPPSMMMSSWMGSDFTNDDLVKESSLVEDYQIRLDPKQQTEDLHVVELTPRKDTATVWGKIVVKVRKADLIPTEQVYFDEKGNKVRFMTLTDIRTFGNRKVPATLEMINLKNKDRKTVIRYTNLEFDIPLDDEIFTLRNLKKRRM